MFHTSIVAFCIAGSALAQVSYPGKCPSVESQSNVDVNKFAGRWYDVARYPVSFEQSTCNTDDFLPEENGAITIMDTFINNTTGEPETFHVRLLLDHQDPSLLRVKFPDSPNNATSDCRILGTDYDHYSVFFCCTELDNVNLRYLFILTADRLPDKSVIDTAYEVIARNDISTKHIEQVDQKNCSSYSFTGRLLRQSLRRFFGTSRIYEK